MDKIWYQVIKSAIINYDIGTKKVKLIDNNKKRMIKSDSRKKYVFCIIFLFFSFGYKYISKIIILFLIIFSLLCYFTFNLIIYYPYIKIVPSKNKKYKNKLIWKKNGLILQILILKFFAFMLNKYSFALNNENNLIKFYISKIKLKVKGPGEYLLLDTMYNFRPDAFYINGERKSVSTNSYRFHLNLTENNVEIIWDKEITHCAQMFYNCIAISEVDLSDFNSSKINSTFHMFYGCLSLASINFNNFDTSKVGQMNNMFYGCRSLTSLNLSHFDTSNIITMRGMFNGCSKLTSLDLSNFNTSEITDMTEIFYGCSSLNHLDISNFDTSKVTNVKNMFYNCFNLTSLNLLNFDTSNITIMDSMFYGCSKLTSLNLSNFNTINVNNMDSLFYNCSSLISLDLSNFNTSNVKQMINMFSYCNSLIFINLKNSFLPNLENDSFIFDHISDNLIIYSEEPKWKTLLNGYDLYINCINYIYNISNNNNNIIENIEYKLYKKNINTEKNKYISDICGENYFEIFNDEKNNNSYINYYKSIINYYYLDKNNIDINTQIFYKPCYSKCKKCDKSGDDINHNCIQCKEDYIYSFIKSDNYLNCDNICENYHYIDINTNITICLNDKNCTENYPQLIEDKNECIDICSRDSIYIYQFENFCYDTFCHPKCKECIGPYSENNQNCSSCKSEDKFLYLGNCVSFSECKKNSYFVENEQKICECELEQCYSCSLESFNLNLCTSCDEEKGFYPIYDELLELYDINNFKNCTKELKGYYLDYENKIFKKCYNSCEECDKGGDDLENNCLKCKSDFYFEIQFTKYKNCYDICRYYHYYDINEKIWFCTTEEKCPEFYDKLILDKKLCVSDCRQDLTYKYEFKKRCYDYCKLDYNCTIRENITIINNNIYNKYFCKPLCNEEAPFEIIYNQDCVKNCAIKYIIDKSCILNYLVIKPISDINNNMTNNEKNEEEKENYKEITKEEENKAKDIMIENIEVGFTADNYDTSNIEKGDNEVVEFENMKITLTTTDNQKSNNSINNNISTIDLGPCEDMLRNIYKIPENGTLYMKKTDVEIKGMKIPKIEYDVYAKLNDSNLIKLNLTYCENLKIDLTVPVKLNEEIDKLNSSSGYYNDLCYIATSESGTDITLNDRKNEFIQNNKTVCQDGCVFTEYDYNLNKAKCHCKVKKSSNSFSDINIDSKKLYDNFINLKNIANINILVCYKVLLSKNGIKKNIGTYLLIPIILMHFISIILFYAKNFFNKLKKIIQDITYGLKNWSQVVQEKKRIKKEKEINEKEKIEKEKLELRKESKNLSEEKDFKTYEISPPIYLRYIHFTKKKLKNRKINEKLKNPPKKINIIKIDTKIMNNNNENKNGENKNDINNINNNETTANNQNGLSNRGLNINNNYDNELVLNKTKLIMKYNDEEINNLSYELALKFDKRTFIEYYISLQKTKHPILFTFFNNNDYNIKLIKFNFFLFGFVLYYIVNALFFNDDTMHKIYEDEGSFNFIYQIPQILYSSIISAIFNSFLQLLALSEGTILEYKSLKKKKKERINLEDKEKKIYVKLQFKFALYFLFSTIFLLFFWYYLSMFCAIYANTQIHLIKDTLLSYTLSLLYPFGIYLIPGIFRIPSLSKNKSKTKKYFYKFSQLLQKI